MLCDRLLVKSQFRRSEGLRAYNSLSFYDPSYRSRALRAIYVFACERRGGPDFKCTPL